MQEDIEHRAVTLAINVSKMTGRTFRNALVKLLHFLKNKQHSSVLLSNDPFLFHEPVLLSGFFRHGCFSILYPTPQTTFR